MRIYVGLLGVLVGIIGVILGIVQKTPHLYQLDQKVLPTNVFERILAYNQVVLIGGSVCFLLGIWLLFKKSSIKYAQSRAYSPVGMLGILVGLLTIIWGFFSRNPGVITWLQNFLPSDILETAVAYKRFILFV